MLINGWPRRSNKEPDGSERWDSAAFQKLVGVVQIEELKMKLSRAPNDEESVDKQETGRDE